MTERNLDQTLKSNRIVEVFVSYAHEDEELWTELSKHLSILKRRNVISVWHDRQIGAGREWKNEIDAHLNAAHIILLLVSADFLASDYCHDVEMKKAMERHEAGEARVIPIILRDCDIEHSMSRKLNYLPTDGKAVTNPKYWSTRDEAFRSIAEGIRHAVDELIESQISVLFEKMSNAESLRNWPNVMALGERVLKLLPDHTTTRSRTAAAYLKRWNRYLGELDDRGYINIRTKRGEDLVEIQTKIIADLDRAIELDSENAEYYFIRGAVRGWVDDVTHAIKLDPLAAKYYYVRAWKEHLDNNETALRDFERAWELGYSEVKIRCARGKVYYDDMKDYKAALIEYRRAAELGDSIGRMMVAKISGTWH